MKRASGNKKSRIKWLKEGDGNSKLFYASVKPSQRQLNIHSIMDGDGTVLTVDDDIKKAAIDYFKNQLTSEGLGDAVCLDVIPRLVTDEGMNSLSLFRLWMSFAPLFLT